jgi:hypothetical protein
MLLGWFSKVGFGQNALKLSPAVDVFTAPQTLHRTVTMLAK